jgi:uncharacterized membrane protein
LGLAVVGGIDADTATTSRPRPRTCRAQPQTCCFWARASQTSESATRSLRRATSRRRPKGGDDRLAILAVALGWATVHTVYTLHYAHLYFGDDAPGGLDFNGDKPDYRDFAYFGFTVGMTWQVSDTDVQKKAIRRTVLHHALLAYLFGTVIVAVTINLVFSLVNVK